MADGQTGYSKDSIRRGTLTTLMVPLCVFALLLAITLHRSLDHALLLRDFSRAVQFVPMTEPLRDSLNRELDGFILASANQAKEPVSHENFRSTVQATAALKQTLDLGQYDSLLDDIGEIALQAEAAHRRASRELDTQGRVSRDTLGRLEEVLEQLYFLRLRASTGFELSLQSIDQSRIVMLETAALHLAQSDVRRLVTQFLLTGTLSRQDAIRALTELHEMESRARKLQEIKPVIQWDPLRRHIQEVGVQFAGYLDEPMLRALREELIPQALRGGTARPGSRSGVPDVETWQELDQHYRAEFERSAQRLILQLESLARTTFRNRLLADGLLLILLILSLTFSFMRFRRFLHRTVDQMVQLEDSLHAISTSADFSRRLPEGRGKELRGITASVNELLEAVSERENRIDSLLKKSEADNVRLAVQTEEISQRHQDLQKAAAELERVNRTLEERSRLLEKSDKVKNEFLANMSHELRTPLNSILLLSDVLIQNTNQHLDREEVESARIVNEAGKNLLALVNNILDFSRIESNEIKLNRNAVHLPFFIETARNQFAPLAGHKELNLRVQMERDVPEVIYTDATRLEQIIHNLLSNAVKFSRHGSITLEVSSSAEGGGTVFFSVRDTGEGIASTDLARVFNAFEQADGSSRRKVGGVGLGLSLSSRLAQLMGGSLHAQSAEGIGSTFTLRLPVGTPADQSESAVEPQAALTPAAPATTPDPENCAIRFDGQTVLLLDDDMRAVFSLARALKDLNLHTLKAPNLERALKILTTKQNQVALACVSAKVADGAGLEFIRQIRADERYANLPVIALSESSDAKSRERCLAAGANHHLAKPFALAELATVMGELLHEPESLRA